MDLEGIIQIGEIINSHGVKGEVKVIPLTDDQEIFSRVKQLILIGNEKRVKYTIINARQVKNYWLIQFDEITDMTSAKMLKKYGIFVEEESIRPLADDEFFIHDLLNSKVYSTENQYLGVITDYFEAGPQGVCEVTLDGDSFLFPTSQEVLKEVIPPGKVIIHLIPDLREINK